MSNMTLSTTARPLSKAESKADTTNKAARSIMDAEVARREAKTAKLREARLAREAAEQQDAAAAAPKKKAAPRKRATGAA